jgi:mRNA-degrading endonuclease RelE of RelBE toxin-antitoxin system
MAFELVIKPIVFLDVEDAINYYEKQSKGLGKRFYDSFLTTLQNIQFHPHHYTIVYNSVRRCMVAKFPYKIFYTIQEEKIFIIGVTHAKRSNTYIRKRLRS